MTVKELTTKLQTLEHQDAKVFTMGGDEGLGETNHIEWSEDADHEGPGYVLGPWG